jgi:HicA toxin of bacterial toxin-antitoxin,
MAKHDRTLQAIFDIPTKATIDWRDVEALFKHLGATVTAAKGSRVRVVLGGVKAVFHRPHPRKEASKGSVESVREFLENAGIEP